MELLSHMPSEAPAASLGKKPPAEPALEAGIFLVDKPVGPSSFRMVQLVRRALSIKKVGHAGTLDPFASGLLIICVGRPATRLISRFMDGNKRYEAVLKLGIETATQDLEGEVVARHGVGVFTQEELEQCLAGFLGEQMQTPPQFSALSTRASLCIIMGIIVEKARGGPDLRLQLWRLIPCVSKWIAAQAPISGPWPRILAAPLVAAPILLPCGVWEAGCLMLKTPWMAVCCRSPSRRARRFWPRS
jgi:hypothetical protein